MSDAYEATAIVYRSKQPNTIIVAPEDLEEALAHDADYGEVHEATCRYLVDKLGFSLDSMEVTANKEQRTVLQTQVEFIDDGIVMAKLQGLID